MPSDDEETKPKRIKKTVVKHESTVVLLDVGCNMSEMVEGTEKSAIDMAKELLDWIITRKIFSKSVDEFTIVLFGSDETQSSFGIGSGAAENIYFCEQEMQNAKVDWLKLIHNEIKTSENIKGDFMSALIVAIDYMRSCLEIAAEGEITSRNILLLSNLLGSVIDEDDSADDNARVANAVVNGIKAIDINFNVIGPSVQYWNDEANEHGENDDEHRPSSSDDDHAKMKTDTEMSIAERILLDIVKRVDGVVYSFTEALPMLQRFIPRRVNIRAQRFYLELSEHLKLPLQFFKKNQPPDMKMTFTKIDQNSGVEVKRQTVYQRPLDDMTLNDGTCSASVDSMLQKEDVIKGYTFGSTIVPFNEEDQKEYGWKRESRCLKLLQFAKRSDILEHYLMDGGVYYCIPAANDVEGAKAISAVIRAMLDEECVALVRYVYNAASSPKIMALFPRISKKGVDMFVGILLPFYEDFRGLEFPPLNDDIYRPKAEQLRTVEAFVDAMDLSNSYFDPESGEYGEDLRPRNVPNPKMQRVCEAIKHRALNPDGELPQFEGTVLSELLQPRSHLLKLAKEPLEWIKKSFPLQEVASRKRKQSDDPLADDLLQSYETEENATAMKTDIGKMKEESDEEKLNDVIVKKEEQ